jgi:hypothetical protein
MEPMVRSYSRLETANPQTYDAGEPERSGLERLKISDVG